MALQNVKRRLRRKRKPVLAGIDVWFGPTADDLPHKPLASFDSSLFASYTGPDCGLRLVHQLELEKQASDAAELSSPEGERPDDVRNSPPKDFLACETLLAGTERWNMKNRKAYGICMSLYDQHPVNGKISGDPIADSFGLCARYNNALLVVADGVNWGEKPKLAARCAVYGCIQHVNGQLFGGSSQAKLSSTADVFKLLMNSLNAAQKMILRHEGGLTTLCIALVCPLQDVPNQFVVCVVNVGDSLAFVFSKRHGIREITTGSHDIRSERDIRDAGGALGPARGSDPELHNLTCSMTCIDAGDIVFLTSDGISDNFDPVVTKIAVAKHSKRDKGDTARYKPSDRNKDAATELKKDAVAESNENSSLNKDEVKPNRSNVESISKSESVEMSPAKQGDKTSESKAQKAELSNDREESNEAEGDAEKTLTIASSNVEASVDTTTTITSITTAVTSATATIVPDFNDSKSASKDQEKTSLESENTIQKAPESNLKTETSQDNAIQQNSEGSNKIEAGKENVMHQSTEDNNTRQIDSESKPKKEICDNKEQSPDKSYTNGADKPQANDSDILIQEEESDEEISPNEQMDGKPVMSPHERHRYAVKEMERVIHEFELFTELSCSAQELCGALLQHVLKLTDPKRKVLENPRLYRRRLKPEDREKRDSEIVARLSRSAGKLDHATIIGYEAGYWHGNEDEEYVEDDVDGNDGDWSEDEDENNEEIESGVDTGLASRANQEYSDQHYTM